MKWVNPPVAYMLHAGVPLLLAAGAHLPGLHQGDASRVALEAYPGLLAREAAGHTSYKSDDRAKQTPERLIARKDLITALEHGQHPPGPAPEADARAARRTGRRRQRRQPGRRAVPDAGRLGTAQGAPGYGLPASFDALEGWIVTA
jgi:hypothetical protein